MLHPPCSLRCLLSRQNRRRCPMTLASLQVDAYMFPCPQCGPAAPQVKQLFDYWVTNGVNVTLLWLDIEGANYWLGDAGSNQAQSPTHLEQSIPKSRNVSVRKRIMSPASNLCRHGTRSCTTRAQPWGSTLAFTVQISPSTASFACPHVHRCAASLSQWSEIFGSASFSHGAAVPLWYAHYDVRQQPPYPARCSPSGLIIPAHSRAGLSYIRRFQ